MASRYKAGARPLRLHRVRKIPKGWQPRVDQANRLVTEILTAYHHFGRDVTHWRDGPARRRLEANHQRLAELLQNLAETNQEDAAVVQQNITNRLQQETARG